MRIMMASHLYFYRQRTIYYPVRQARGANWVMVSAIKKKFMKYSTSNAGTKPTTFLYPNNLLQMGLILTINEAKP